MTFHLYPYFHDVIDLAACFTHDKFLPDCYSTEAKMGTTPEEQIAAFKKFLTEFSALHPNPIAEEDAMPFRINTFRMTEDELEGECMDWVLEYLQERK